MFIEKIEELIAENNTTAKKMLNDTNISAGSFNNWKERDTVPSGTIIAKIAKYFNVTTDYILGLSEQTASADKPMGEVLTDKETEMLCNYRQLDIEDRAEIRGQIKGMLKNDKYTSRPTKAIG